MSPKIKDGFSEKGYVPEFWGRFIRQRAMSPIFEDGFFGIKLCPRKSGTVFWKNVMSPIFGDTFFGKALCPRTLLIGSTDCATLLSKVLAQTN